MEIVFLGTGTSQGVPMIACDCAVCTSGKPRNSRTRTSIHVEMGGYHIQVDAAPEFRLQCLRESINWTDLFILTHSHTDHMAGMDDLRRFCDLHGGSALTVYSTPAGLDRVRSAFPYTATDRPKSPGYAAFRLLEMPRRLDLPQGTVESVMLPHGNVTTLGLVFIDSATKGKFVYYSDCKSVPAEALQLARGADVVVLDGLRPLTHPSHMTIGEAIEVGREIGAPRTLITHLTHLNDHDELAASLPRGFEPAYDGLRIRL